MKTNIDETVVLTERSVKVYILHIKWTNMIFCL